MSNARRSDDEIARTRETEYKALRDEMLRRLDYRTGRLQLTVAAATVFLNVGLLEQAPSAVLLLYPIVALLLASGYVYNGLAIVDLSRYIREEIEKRTEGLRRETSLKGHGATGASFGWLESVSGGGLFLVTQILAFGLGVRRSRMAVDCWASISAGDWLLIGLDITSIVFVFWLFFMYSWRFRR
jgi:hypothetical protein